uniref:Pectinesterase n=1 Tax=Wollemia nobilis TaxID=56998 RepID=A0A0C9QM20_9CONI
MRPGSPLGGYGRLQRPPQPKSKKKKVVLAIVLLALVLSVALVAVAAGIVIIHRKGSGNGDAWKSGSRVIDMACSKTLYPALCVSTLVSFPGVDKANRQDFAHITVNVTMDRVQQTYGMALNISGDGMSSRERLAYEDCLELLEGTVDHLNVSLGKMSNVNMKSSKRQIADVQTLLSAALTNYDTCLDGFGESEGNAKSQIEDKSMNLSEMVSNSLAMLKISFPDHGLETNEFHVPPVHNRRRLLGLDEKFYEQYGIERDESEDFPAWLSAGDRRLLQLPNVTAVANVIVAQDGTGKFTTIAAAIEDAPSKSNQRYIIYVRAGLYRENVTVSRKKTNIMIVGDGRGKTIVAAGRNVKDGFTTYRSATFGASGKGFIARDVTFLNTAGPGKHQAVALRVGADFSALYHCDFMGYQDTLYVHSLRQFYRECDIYGTVDFIFGNAAVVFQNCNIFPRRPMPNQKNTITAQNRKDPNQNTGISIHNCRVTAARDLVPVKSSIPTYLGRPWKMYARTVYMQTFLDDLINPAGWLEWSGDFALNTLYYGEYMNTGPGARLDGRVRWPGFKVIQTADEAGTFTVANFISGTSWLPSTGIAFIGGLLV